MATTSMPNIIMITIINRITIMTIIIVTKIVFTTV